MARKQLIYYLYKYEKYTVVTERKLSFLMGLNEAETPFELI